MVKHKDNEKDCTNYLNQSFNPKAPNIVRTSDFTYIKADVGDMKMLYAIAQMAKQELGYDILNIFDSFIQDQEDCNFGALDD